MADPQGFLKYRERETLRSRPVPVRILDNREVYERRQEDSPALVRQATRCMDCGVPFCHSGCPLGNLIPEWNELTRREDFATAIERLHATNNFPEFTGKLCPAPCETACVLGINQPAVTIKYIEESIIAEAFDQGLVEPQIPQRLTGQTVAVIGSGPAGLAAAQQLTRAGHTVAVFERDDRIGGLLTYGIPDFKMEKSHVDRRLAQMEAEGTRFRPGVDVGGTGEGAISGEELRERYDAVVLAMGSTVPRDLDAPGRDFGGVHHAMPYLTQHNRVVAGREVPDQILATGKDVVVIGGGDTGSDCYGTALRQQARSVTQIDINPIPDEERPADHPWPTYPRIFRVSTSHEEGGERIFGASTVEFLADDDGNVSGIRLVDVIRDKDRNVTPIEGTERVLPADLVLLALGFTGVPAGGLVEQLGIELDDRGRLTRNDDYATSVPGVYVAGDAGRGQSLIVWAIAEGRAAAASVDRYLRGEDSELPVPVLPSTAPVSA
ncbi:glutamate synthase subunit beta [Bogoriella caseilytica]|uniref:Glutamate synthase (NADH) small subunit n=1 Tax=Bogoriella caseilytica TaxID=56055 RepID=A0A3N2B8Q3_9MICO|nr:glutamate synthase subunit beta [Bogoriella caseilytica]ROR71665.1 glutamate synthase (NADH) small subunit [Bogoriella caseilytica]